MRLTFSPFVFIFERKEYYGVLEMNSQQEGVYRIMLLDEEFEIELCHFETSYWGQVDNGDLSYDFLQAVGDGITALGLNKSFKHG